MLAAPGRGLQECPDRGRRLGDVGEQFGQRVAHRQRVAAPVYPTIKSKAGLVIRPDSTPAASTT